MIFNASNEFDIQRAKERLGYLIEKKKTFEITEKKPKRTYSQINYILLHFSWFALEYVEITDIVKQDIFKKLVNPQIFLTEYVNYKTGEVRAAWRSTADLNTKEMTTAIDNFRDYASKEAGIYLPTPDDLTFLNEIERQVNNLQGRYY